MEAVRAVIFDLDECVIDARAAWVYTVEQTLIAITGRQLRLGEELVEEYRARPWRHAFSILCADPAEAERCCEMAEAMYHRSALKRLLVHDGIGMALDALRARRIQIGVISRLPHGKALKQIESTGIDRFVLVLSPTPIGEAWSPRERINEAISYLGRTYAESVFVSTDDGQTLSFVRVVRAGWACGSAGGLSHPRELTEALQRLI